MADDDKYASERYVSRLPQCQRLSLLFDGKTLHLRGATRSYKYRAVSGKSSSHANLTFSYTEARQKLPNQGPIPAGNYWISPRELTENAWWRRMSTAAWGNYRITIHPLPNTKTFKRGGFFIHGGAVPGSSGCIDLWDHMDTFIEDLRGQLSTSACQIPLTVKYVTTTIKLPH